MNKDVVLKDVSLLQVQSVQSMSSKRKKMEACCPVQGVTCNGNPQTFTECKKEWVHG